MVKSRCLTFSFAETGGGVHCECLEICLMLWDTKLYFRGSFSIACTFKGKEVRSRSVC